MGLFRKKRITFKATKVVKVPVKVTFYTYDGERVSFMATKAVRVSRPVSFQIKRKRRWRR